MNEKFSLKIIQHGKTQQARLIQSGAGMAGQAVVIQAADAARYQLVNVVTLISPAKLQLKRVGDALHLVMPGGDIEAPDLVIQDYFKVTGASLQGSSISGEWMNYDTASLANNPALSVAGTDTLSSSVVDKTSNVSLGGEGVLGTFTEHPWLWAGGIAGAAAAGGGGGGGSTPASDTSPLGIIQTYANASAGAGVTAPTLATYKSAGVKALASLSETTASADIDSTAVATAMGTTWLAAINSAVDKRTDGSTLTVAQLQSLADSYYRILSEADGVVNTSTDTIVYPSTGISNPTATDYTNIGATVGNAKSVDLLNDFVGLSLKAAVDTVDEINTVAAAAYNVMLNAGVSAGTGTLPAVYTLDTEWITGLTALGIVGVNANNIVAVKAALAGHSDGTAVDTVQEIKDLIKNALALQQLQDYANAANGVGVTAPTLTTYSDAGIKTFKSLTDTGVVNRKALGDSSTANGADSNIFLTAATLNTALDQLLGSGLTYDATYTGTVQKMVDSYYRILREADGKYMGDSNGGTSYYNNSDAAHTAITDVYADTTNDSTNAAAYTNPTLADFANIGITVADAISATSYVAATGAGNETLNLLNDAIGRMTTTSVDTVAEIQVLATTANDIMLLAKGSNTSASQSDANLITGLNLLLGLNTTTGLNTNNIAAMKDAIVATNDTGLAVDAVSELLSLLGLVRLQSFTNDSAAFGSKSVSVPSLNDWSSLGLTANTSLTDGSNVSLNNANYWKTTNAGNGLNALNSALDTYTGVALGTFDGTVMSNGVLQGIVDSYGRILQQADGSRATVIDVNLVSDTAAIQNVAVIEQDLINVGVKHTGSNGATTIAESGIFYSYTGELLASSIGSLSSTSAGTVAQLNSLSDVAENVMREASDGTASVSYTTDAQWASALTSLGFTGVTTANMAAINTKIHSTAGSDLQTYDELQAIVSLVRVNDYAALNTGNVTPTLSDYEILTLQGSGSHLYTDAKSAYLNGYNDYVNTQASITSADTIETMVVSYNLIFDLADGSRSVSNTPTTLPAVTDYNTILGTGVVTGATGIAAAGTETYLLNDIINGLTTTQVDSVSKLQGLDATVKKLLLDAGGTAQTFNRTELTNLGLTDGNGHTLLDSNSSTGTYWITNAQLLNFQNVQAYNKGVTAVDTFAELQQMMSAAVLAA